MQKMLISACLLGHPVRFDGKELPLKSQLIKKWVKEGRLLSFCPEVEGGLSVPRPASEIQNTDGLAVLEGDSKVLTKSGADVTKAYIQGAEFALQLVHANNIKFAVLKSKSPACGSGVIYDGSFSRVLRTGDGVTAAALRKEGIKVFTENQITEAEIYLKQIESDL
jgi:uncharacterized protein YbbK (DUF523 family)